ncbi:MAG: YceD family protein [Geminicoccaceae bacterium]
MTPTSEFSRIVMIEPWPTDGIVVEVVATSAECQRLKERFDLVHLKSLKAAGKIKRAGDGLVFDGMLEAEATQSCVVSLAPVPSAIEASFKRRFVRRDKMSDQGGQDDQGDAADDLDEISLHGDDADTDLIEADHIDVGEVIAEEFYLALDSYPRAKDADVVMAEVQGTLNQDDLSSSENPFAKLRRH